MISLNEKLDLISDLEEARFKQDDWAVVKNMV